MLILLGIILTIAGLWSFIFILSTASSFLFEDEGMVAAIYDAYHFTNLLMKMFAVAIIALAVIVFIFGFIYNLFV